MRRREMGIAAAIYTLAGTGLVTLIYLLSKAMLKGLDWLTTKRRRPFSGSWSNAMLADIEAEFSKAWKASEQ